MTKRPIYRRRKRETVQRSPASLLTNQHFRWTDSRPIARPKGANYIRLPRFGKEVRI